MCLADRTDLLVDEHGLVNHMRDSGELADGLVFLIAQQVVELRIDLLQIIGDLGDGLFQCHLCHDAADAGEHGGVELPWLGELQMFDDAPVRLPYNTGLERSLLTVLAVFGDQLSRFLGEFYPTSAFDHGVAGCLCAFAGRGDGLYGFGCECFGIEAFILEPEIYGTSVAEEDDALFVLDDGDALRVVWIVVPGVGIGITVSAFEWDEFVGIVVDHGYFLQIHLVAVYDRQTRRCAWEWR